MADSEALALALALARAAADVESACSAKGSTSEGGAGESEEQRRGRRQQQHDDEEEEVEVVVGGEIQEKKKDGAGGDQHHQHRGGVGGVAACLAALDAHALARRLGDMARLRAAAAAAAAGAAAGAAGVGARSGTAGVGASSGDRGVGATDGDDDDDDEGAVLLRGAAAASGSATPLLGQLRVGHSRHGVVRDAVDVGDARAAFGLRLRGAALSAWNASVAGARTLDAEAEEETAAGPAAGDTSVRARRVLAVVRQAAADAFALSQELVEGGCSGGGEAGSSDPLAFLSDVDAEDVLRALHFYAQAGKAWSDLGEPARAEAAFRRAMVFHDRLAADAGCGGHPAACADLVRRRREEAFRVLCWRAAAAWALSQREVAFDLARRAGELAHHVSADDRRALAVMCFDLGAGLAGGGGARQRHAERHDRAALSDSIAWLRRAFEIAEADPARSEDEQARTLRFLARQQLALGDDLDQALEAVSLALERRTHPAGLYLKAKILAAKKLHVETREALLEASLSQLCDEGMQTAALDALDHLAQSQRFGAHPDGHSLSAVKLEVLLKLGDRKGAAALVDHICDAHMRRVETLSRDTLQLVQCLAWNTGSALFDEGRPRECAEWFLRTAALAGLAGDAAGRKAQARCFRIVARAYLSDGQLEPAEEYVERALSLDPASARAHYLSFKMCCARGDLEGATRSLEAVCERAASARGGDARPPTSAGAAASAASVAGSPGSPAPGTGSTRSPSERLVVYLEMCAVDAVEHRLEPVGVAALQRLVHAFQPGSDPLRLCVVLRTLLKLDAAAAWGWRHDEGKGKEGEARGDLDLDALGDLDDGASLDAAIRVDDDDDDDVGGSGGGGGSGGPEHSKKAARGGGPAVVWTAAKARSLAGHLRDGVRKLYDCAVETLTSARVQEELQWLQELAWDCGVSCCAAHGVGRCAAAERFAFLEEGARFFETCGTLCELRQRGADAEPSETAQMKKLSYLLASCALVDVAERESARPGVLLCDAADAKLAAALQLAQKCRQASSAGDNLKGRLFFVEFKANALLGGSRAVAPEGSVPRVSLARMLEDASSMGARVVTPEIWEDVGDLLDRLAARGLPTPGGPASSSTGALATEALGTALRLRLQQAPAPDLAGCARLVRKTVEAAGRGRREDALPHFEKALKIIQGRAGAEDRASGGVDGGDSTDRYPAEEIEWLLVTAWNNGVHFFRLRRYQQAEKWMGVAFALLRSCPHPKQFEHVMTDGYSQVALVLHDTHDARLGAAVDAGAGAPMEE